jgi:hypothetical protein
MNIGKYMRFLRRSKPFNWHSIQLLHHEHNQQGGGKIVEYQDRWTASPTRAGIWFSSRDNYSG